MRIIESVADFFGLRIDDADLDAAAFEGVVESASTRRMALYIAISYISNALSKCEIKTYENGKAVKGELYYALNVCPNPNQNGATFMNQLVEELFYEGHALMVQPRRGQARFHIADAFNRDKRPLHEDRFSDIQIGNDSISRTFKASDVCYFRLSEKHESRMLVAQLGADLGAVLGQAMNSFSMASGERWLMETEGRAGGKRSDEVDQVKELSDRLKPFIRNPNSVLPVYKGESFKRAERNAASASSSDIIELRKDIFEATAAAFHIPTSMMYGNMTNMAEIMRQFLTFAVDPVARMLDDELTRKFCGLDGWRDGSRIHVDTSKVTHLDMFEVAEKADKLIASGAFCIDEVREPLGADPLDTDFSTAHWVTKNYAPIDEAYTQLSLDFGE